MDAQAQQPVGEEPRYRTNGLYPETEQASYSSIITHNLLFVNRFSEFFGKTFSDFSKKADQTAGGGAKAPVALHFF